jgi:hypothetical protein
MTALLVNGRGMLLALLATPPLTEGVGEAPVVPIELLLVVLVVLVLLLPTGCGPVVTPPGEVLTEVLPLPGTLLGILL